MQAPSTLERRRSKRSPITIGVKKLQGNRLSLCQASNICAEGIFIARVEGEPEGPGETCVLEFCLPRSDVPIRARGRVVRQRDYSRYHLSAVHFTAIAPSHRRLIRSYVESPQQNNEMPVFLPPPWVG
jgi:hypothetical protein